MHVSKPLVILALVLALLLAACATSSTNTPATPTPQKPAGSSSGSGSTGSGAASGETLVNSRCTVCHNTDRIKAAKKTPDQWKATVERMVGKGAQLNAEEQSTVIKYLSETYK